MDKKQVLDVARSLDGILVLAPAEGGPHPEIAWGDYFFYYAPDGKVPTNTQPFATIVTKNYPDDTASGLDGEDRWRVNIHVGTQRFRELTGFGPREIEDVDHSEADAILPHPVYGELGWVCVVNPADRTESIVIELLRSAHDDARTRALRRQRHPSS